MKNSLLKRSALAGALMLAFAPQASAVDIIFSSGNYIPGTTAPDPLPFGVTLQINSGGNKFFNGVTMTSQSTVNWNADTLYLQNGAVINNQSLWDAKSDNALANNGGPMSAFNNSAVFRKSAGAGTTSIGSIAFTNSGFIDAQTGTILFGGGNVTFNAGSAFTGAGAVVVGSNASFNGAFSSANLTISNGSITGSGAQLFGAMTLSGGALVGDWEVTSGQQLNLASGGNKFLNGASLTNNGTVSGLTGDALYLQNGASFVNNGLHDLQQSTSLVNNGGPLSSYVNNSGATLQVAAGKSVNVGTIAFTNNGATLTSNGTLTFSGGNTIFNAGSTFNGSGQIVVSSNASFNGGFNAGNLLLTNGSFVGSAAVLNGTLDFSGGALNGDWTIAAGQLLRGQDGGNKFLNGASVTNLGTVQWNSANNLYLQNGASFDNQGLFDMQGSTSLINNGGPLSSFTNSGTLHQATGQTGSVGSIAFTNNGGTISADGALTFGGGNVRFNNGTVFNGGGTINLTNNASFVGGFNSGNLVLSNGAYTGGDGSAGSKATINGSVKFNTGAFTGNWKLANGQQLLVKNGGNKFLNGAQFNNNGDLLWQTGDNLYMQNGSVLDNNGLFEMQTGTAIINNGGPLSVFNNNNMLRVDSGQNGSIGSIAFYNNGGATIHVGSGGSLNLNGGNVTFNANSQSTGSGVLMVTNNASFNGSFTTSNLSLRNGSFNGSAAVLHGNAEWTGGALTGGWTVANGASMTILDGNNKFINGGALTNQGTLNWQTGNATYFQNAAFLTNQGTLNLQSDASLVYNGGPVGSLLNTGLIAKTAGAGTSTIGNGLGFDNQGVVDVQTGTIRLPDNFTNNGTLMGNGAFTTNLLTNAGHVAPGASPGTLTLNGNYAQSAGGYFDVDLSTLASSDLLLINGAAALNGTLELNCYAGCHFAVGDHIVILDATGQLTGSFGGTLNLHGFASGAFNVIYDRDQERVILEVTQAVSALPVPEPASYAMLAGGLLLLLVVRRRTQAAATAAWPCQAAR
jgi:hypothetical protein